MTIRLGIPKELSEGESRVALVPDVVGRLVKMGYEVCIERGAGEASFFPNESYEKAGAKLQSREQILQNSQVILKVAPPLEEEIKQIPNGAILISFLYPYRFPDRVRELQNKKITSFAMELIPRVTRAQSMDALSSQATVNGYKAVLIAADRCSRFFPMLTTAAGTIRPAKVLVLGAGVAGLQAIATSRRLGAVVEAYDIRKSSREQIESLGAKFVQSTVDGEGQGGYARELSAEEKKKDQETLDKHIASADVVISTAHVPGRPAPILISEEVVGRMKPGSVIVDLSAESGGNCVLTKLGTEVVKNGVRIVGPANLSSSLPFHASEMYAKNMFNFLTLLTQEGKTLSPNLEDEIIIGSLLSYQGEIKHAPTKALLEEKRS
ncbi:MAG: Re/Si-specific NAD(P)(+) transhydrogenase subunit alpha [Deltaproteobacteria bacterium]|nr:Re/Si-specific NAD(P)(+) transhydrogenase subunit alpha [Deltaproteobacteria bacterium]